MSAKPKAHKRSAAQIAASKKWAAGGRAGQARKRAANKAAGKPTRSKAQTQASLRFAAAGRRAQAAKKAGKPAQATKKAAMPATLFPWLGPAIWLTGCNEERPTCAAVALANHLLAVTGIVTPDRHIMALHELAGGDEGATIETVLEAASVHGMNGYWISEYWPTDETIPGLVCGIQTRRGYHAVLSHTHGMVTWGMLLQPSGELRERWALDWITHDAG